MVAPASRHKVDTDRFRRRRYLLLLAGATDGTKGEANQANLYVYRKGAVQFVTTLTPGRDCDPEGEEGRVATGRLRECTLRPPAAAWHSLPLPESPDNNDGVHEMYTYDPSTGKTCACHACRAALLRRGGVGSEGGLFMSDDGRTFFYTPDALVAQDTNELHDVYEYVEGRPQLMTTGNGSEDAQKKPNQYRQAGLQGVSADGVNVYFSTFNTLVPQDIMANS